MTTGFKFVTAAAEVICDEQGLIMVGKQLATADFGASTPSLPSGSASANWLNNAGTPVNVAFSLASGCRVLVSAGLSARGPVSYNYTYHEVKITGQTFTPTPLKILIVRNASWGDYITKMRTYSVLLAAGSYTAGLWSYTAAAAAETFDLMCARVTVLAMGAV